MIQSLFSIPLYVADIPIKFEWVDSAMALETYKGESNRISVSTCVLDQPEFAALRKSIDQHLQAYMDEVVQPRHKDTRIYITESWINYTWPNGYHHSHIHNNSFVSCVLYMQAKNSSITFESPMDLFGLSVDARGQSMMMMHHAKAETDKLYIFPSRLRHDVSPHKEESTRISLAFNTFLSGTISNINTVKLQL